MVRDSIGPMVVLWLTGGVVSITVGVVEITALHFFAWSTTRMTT